tara:strand:- start:17877 stop:20426 length:2550 start_codon:yes stop_codon:yes gene_type:complete
MMNSRFRFFVFALLLLFPWCLQAKQSGITPDQLKVFQQLSPDQQKQFLKAKERNASSKGTEFHEPPAIVKPRDPQDGRYTTTGELNEKRKVELIRQGRPTSLDADPDTRQEQVTISEWGLETVAYTNDEIKPFGYELFAGTPSTFAPANDIPTPVNYVVGPGDVVDVQLYGKENEEYSLVVSREGELHFPEVGPITVAGLRYEEMLSLVSEEVTKRMIGVKVKIAMGRLHSVGVFVLGDAYRPGSYTVSALSTMTNALFVSGGVEHIGSLRKIQLKRQGELVTQLDLYDFLLDGNTSGDARLQPGDVIFVPPVGPRATIAGSVRRPAIYELNGEVTLGEVLELAGGTLATAYLPLCRIERLNDKGERTLLVVDLEKDRALETAISDGDIISLGSALDEFGSAITVRGHVKRPGAVQWAKGMHLSDVINSPHMLLAKADLSYVLIRREISIDRRIELRSVDLAEFFSNPQSSQNIELQPRDEIIVFPLGDQKIREAVLVDLIEELRLQATEGEPVRVVSVVGSIQSPGEYPLEAAMRVSSLIRASGSLQDAAYMHSAEVTRYTPSQENGLQIQHISIDLSKALAGDKVHDILLQPYDRLHIKPLPEFASRGIVELAGEVQFPGTYTIRRGESLRDLLDRAGGLTQRAYPEGAVFLREALRKREQETLDRLAKQAESDLAAYALQEAAGVASKDLGNIAAALGPLLADLKKAEAVGRLVIDLPAILKDERNDIILEDGDRIAVPYKPVSVAVMGEVQFPTSHMYNKKWSRRSYVDSSGGLTYKADRQRIYVVRANGSVMPKRTFGCTNVLPGDTIVVPLKVDRMSQLTLWTAATQIIYNLAVSTAAVKSIF